MIQITKAAYLISSARVEQCPKPVWPEYPFIGRSNVGKSSLINMLCNHSKLAKISAQPGKTQLINHFEIESRNSQTHQKQHWYLVDLPGYGFAYESKKKRNEWKQMIEQYFTKRANIAYTFVLIDSRLPPQPIDLEFINHFKAWQLPFALVFTKTDKEKNKNVLLHTQLFLDEMKKTWQFLPQCFITSARNKTGREELLQFITATNENFMIHS